MGGKGNCPLKGTEFLFGKMKSSASLFHNKVNIMNITELNT